MTRDLDEIRQLAGAMEATVTLLNTFSGYLLAESGSPREDQLEAELEDRVMKIHKSGQFPDVILGLCALILDLDLPERVQAFFDSQSHLMQIEVDEIRAQQED